MIYKWVGFDSSLRRILAQFSLSPFFCRVDGLHNDIVHPTWLILLEGRHCHFLMVVESDTIGLQLTRNDPSASKRLNRAALALATYGALIFMFWSVSLSPRDVLY
jgi:hypothetical protein